MRELELLCQMPGPAVATGLVSLLPYSLFSIPSKITFLMAYIPAFLLKRVRDKPSESKLLAWPSAALQDVVLTCFSTSCPLLPPLASVQPHHPQRAKQAPPWDPAAQSRSPTQFPGAGTCLHFRAPGKGYLPREALPHPPCQIANESSAVTILFE